MLLLKLIHRHQRLQAEAKRPGPDRPGAPNLHLVQVEAEEWEAGMVREFRELYRGDRRS